MATRWEGENSTTGQPLSLSSVHSIAIAVKAINSRMQVFLSAQKKWVCPFEYLQSTSCDFQQNIDNGL